MIVTLKSLQQAPVDPFALLPDDERSRLCHAAVTDVSILLLGETGTGKGQLARALAARSKRPEIVEVNCAALPDELLGSELFGHRKGAFTGAQANRQGILLAAAGKTVFLDEIGEVSPNMQRMLLRVVQRSRRTIKPLGADDAIPLPPLRFIFATNRDLETEVALGQFREDLLRRIDVVTVIVPPLRSRLDLIPAYAGRFLEELSALHGIEVKGVERSALTLLAGHTWPGNVRELKNVLERALVTAPRSSADPLVVRARDIRLTRALPQALAGAGKAAAAGTLADAEAHRVREAMAAAGGSVTRAMEILGVRSRSTMYVKLKKHGISIEKVTQ